MQLWYQFALNGRRELPYAPDPRTGFEMTLLRMLSFRADTTGADAKSPRASMPTPRVLSATSPDHSSHAAAVALNASASMPEAAAAVENAPLPIDADGLPEWETWIVRARLGGMVDQLARHAAPKSLEGGLLTLALKPLHKHLAVEPLCGELQKGLGDALGRTLRVRFVIDAETETPAARAERARSAEQATAERALAEDPVVLAMQRELGARVVPQSIKPTEQQP